MLWVALWSFFLGEVWVLGNSEFSGSTTLVLASFSLGSCFYFYTAPVLVLESFSFLTSIQQGPIRHYSSSPAEWRVSKDQKSKHIQSISTQENLAQETGPL